MKLYISDLDGTLVNSDKKLSENTIYKINTLIHKGLNFSIATARSLESARNFLEPLDIKLPIVLHNGVFIYDPVIKENIVSNYLDYGIVDELLKVFLSRDISPLVYAIDNNYENKIYYRGIFTEGEKYYYEDRVNNGDNRFELVEKFSVKNMKIMTILAIGDEKVLRPLYDEIKNKFNLTFHYSVDIYSKETWFEITHKEANKGSAVEYLKNYLNADKLVCFGDHLNDIAMFKVADEGYAVQNAQDDLKKHSTSVILSNDEDGVANFIEGTFNS